MIVPDVNVIIHAYNADSPVHDLARGWWEQTLGAPEPVGLAWSVVLGYIRITTHTRILSNPLPPSVACGHVEAWLGQPQVTFLHPGERHAAIFFDLLRRLGTAANLKDRRAPRRSGDRASGRDLLHGRGLRALLGSQLAESIRGLTGNQLPTCASSPGMRMKSGSVR